MQGSPSYIFPGFMGKPLSIKVQYKQYNQLSSLVKLNSSQPLFQAIYLRAGSGMQKNGHLKLKKFDR